MQIQESAVKLQTDTICDSIKHERTKRDLRYTENGMTVHKRKKMF